MSIIQLDSDVKANVTCAVYNYNGTGKSRQLFLLLLPNTDQLQQVNDCVRGFIVQVCDRGVIDSVTGLYCNSILVYLLYTIMTSDETEKFWKFVSASKSVKIKSKIFEVEKNIVQSVM